MGAVYPRMARGMPICPSCQSPCALSCSSSGCRACRSDAMSLMQHSGVGDSKVGRNVMSTARNLTRGLWCKFVLLSVTLPLLSGSAFAQIPAPDSSSSANPFSPKMSLGEKEKRQLTPEEQERQRQLDAAYKAATKKIPDQKTADPWGGVRPTPTVKGQFKNESLTPYHRDSFNKQTTQ